MASFIPLLPIRVTIPTRHQEIVLICEFKGGLGLFIANLALDDAPKIRDWPTQVVSHIGQRPSLIHEFGPVEFLLSVLFAEIGVRDENTILGVEDVQIRWIIYLAISTPGSMTQCIVSPGSGSCTLLSIRGRLAQ